jgi:tetratricopeptide (TPR) repeat protein
MESIDVDGTPFSVLMDRAVKLKTLQSKHERIKYDAHPSFYGNTIFPNDEVAIARRLGQFDEKLAVANAMKEEGNSAYRDGRFRDALARYEMAASVFRYLENANPEWKTQGIKDKFVTDVVYECESEGERRMLDIFLVACYINIALASYKMDDFSLAVDACGYAMAIDKRNDKAFFLRARARLGPKSSGVVEEKMARMDLSMALEINPDNGEARRLLRGLDSNAKKQRAKDKIAFGGLFDRGGAIYDDPRELRERNEARGGKRAEQDDLDSRQRDIVLGRQLARLYEERGMVKEKERIEHSLQYEMKAMEKRSFVDDSDFRNPTAKMVDNAKSMGVDLTDPRTVELLEELKGGDQEWVRKSERSGNQSATGSPPEGQVTWPRPIGLGRLLFKIISGFIIAGYIFAYLK